MFEFLRISFVRGIDFFVFIRGIILALKFQLKIGLKESIVLNNVRFLLFDLFRSRLE